MRERKCTMNDNSLQVNVRLVDDKVKFLAASNLQPDKEIAFDYVPPVGSGEGFLGLELLLMSFTGCVSTAIVFLLRRMGHSVVDYRMNASAIRRENPISLEKIFAEISIDSASIPTADVERAIQQASCISPVWLAVKNNVDVSLAYKTTE